MLSRLGHLMSRQFRTHEATTEIRRDTFGMQTIKLTELSSFVYSPRERQSFQSLGYHFEHSGNGGQNIDRERLAPFSRWFC
jgi:hypothetical protein